MGLPNNVYVYSVNRELVRRGLAQLCGPTNELHQKSIENVPAYSRLVTQLEVSQYSDMNYVRLFVDCRFDNRTYITRCIDGITLRMASAGA
jgi:hypothetical protein